MSKLPRGRRILLGSAQELGVLAIHLKTDGVVAMVNEADISIWDLQIENKSMAGING